MILHFFVFFFFFFKETLNAKIDNYKIIYVIKKITITIKNVRVYIVYTIT